MSSIVKVGKADTAMMEMRFSGADMNISYAEVGIEANTYACTGCGLVWDRKWYAETCESRNHVPSWEQRYGGYIENGVPKGYKGYVRQALQRRLDLRWMKV